MGSKQTVLYSFYDCDDCAGGYAIEADITEEPTCPFCQSAYFRHVGDVELPMPLPVKGTHR